MLEDNQETNTGYKIHCLEIAMSELKNELMGLKDHIAHREMLRNDFREIKMHAGDPRSMFLFKTYW